MPTLRKSVQMKVDQLPAALPGVGRNPKKAQPKKQDTYQVAEQDQGVIFAAAERGNWETITRIYDALELERELSEMPCEHRVNLATRLNAVLTVSKEKRRGIFVADVTPMDGPDEAKGRFERGRKLRTTSGRDVQERGIEVSGTGRTALHIAAQAHAPLTVVEALIKLQPSAVRSRDNASSTPLHLAAGGGFCFARAKGQSVHHEHVKPGVKPVNENKRARNIISALVDAAPELASAVDEHNHTPLDVAVANRKWMAVERLVEAAPACVKRSDAAPLPLYASALAGAAPPRVLRCLEEAHPRSDMPLPSLVKCKFYDDALKAVTEEAAKRKDDRDRLPLHLVAADPDAPEALITALLEAFPQATNARDKAGWLPLHDSAHVGGPSKLYRCHHHEPPRFLNL